MAPSIPPPSNGKACPIRPVPGLTNGSKESRRGIFQPGHRRIRRVRQNASADGLFSLTKTGLPQLRSRRQPIRQLHTDTFTNGVVEEEVEGGRVEGLCHLRVH